MKPIITPFPFIIAIFACASISIPAATLYWDGNSTTADADGGAGAWDTATSNWDDAPVAGLDVTWPALSSGDDDASFGGIAGTVTVDAGGITVNDITFATASYVVTGGPLTLNSLDPDGPDPLPAPLPAVTNAGAATISSNLLGTFGLNKIGNGILTISGDNSGLSGPLVVSGATSGNNGGIIANSANAISGITSIDIQNGSFLQLQALTLPSSVPISLAGGGGFAAPLGALRGAAGASVVNGAVSIVNGAVRVGNSGTSTTFAGSVTAANASGFGLTIRQAGNQGVIFSNVGNYWEANTILSDGSVYFHPGTLPSASNLVNAASGNTWFETNGTFSRSIGTAAGEVQFNGTAARINGLSARGGALTVNLGGAAGTLVWGTGGFTPGVLGLAGGNATDTLTFLNPIDLNGANRTIDAQPGLAEVDAILPGPLSGPASSALSKTGRGVIELTGPNTYPGGTTISGSQGAINPLRISHADALGTGNLTVGAGGNNDQARLELTGGITVINGIPALTSRNNFVPSFINVSGDNTLTSNISSGGGGARITFQSNDGLLTLSGTCGVRNPNFIGDGDFLVSGNINSPATYRTLVKSGSGTLTLTGASNVTDTATTISGGILQIGNGGTTGTPGIAPITNDSTLVFNRDGALTVDGSVSGSGQIINRGPGVVTLAGATIALTGGVKIEDGSLLVNGDASTASGGFTVGDGVGSASTAVLGGTGILGGNIVLDADGSIAPAGLAVAGTLDCDGAISGTGALQLELDGTSGDKVIVGGILDISAVTLNLAVINVPTAPVYVLVDASSAITGAAFASVTGLPSGYSLEYNYNDGVDTHNIALVQSGSPFTTWATITSGLAGGDAAPGADPDSDGLNNLVEFVLGGQPNPANPNASSVALAPTQVIVGSNLIFTYRRTDLSTTEAGLVTSVEFGTNLSGWTTAVNGVGGVTITETPDGFGSGVDKVEVSIPMGTETKLFARLKATLP